MPALSPDDLDNLIACPHCDALHAVREPEKGGRAVCTRCHATLIAPRKQAGMIIIMLALAVAILVVGALFFPFLSISRLGLSNSATLLDAAWAFSGGPLFLLSLAVLALIVVIPLARALLILYTLAPLVFDRRPPPRARAAFALAERLRPWSMAEIFAIGCAVSLVKVADLAELTFGPAFWMFTIVVILATIQDGFMCRWSVWRDLERAQG